VGHGPLVPWIRQCYLEQLLASPCCPARSFASIVSVSGLLLCPELTSTTMTIIMIHYLQNQLLSDETSAVWTRLVPIFAHQLA